MNKIFAIVIKNRKKYPAIVNKNLEGISLFDDLNTQTCYFNDLFIITASSRKNEIIQETKTKILACSGIFYPDFSPKTPKDQSEAEKLKFLADEYEKKEDKAIIGIHGKFNLFIYNKDDNKLIVLNDRLGLYPLFFYENEDYVLLCNDYEPILKFDNSINKQIDPVSVLEYFLFGAPQNNKTFFKSIKLMPPGSIMTVSSTGIKTQKNFPVLKIQKNQKHISEIADDYFSVFKKELDLILKWYPEMDVTLTGGADTRMILGAMSDEERMKRTFVTFSSSYVPDDLNQDIQIANLLSQKYHLNHIIIPNELYAISTLDNNYFKKLRVNSRFFISGYLGSETLRFYSPYPNNISEITRALITSDEKTYDYFSDFLIFLDKNLSYKQKLNKGLSFLAQYFKPDISVSFSLRNSIKEIMKSVDFIKTAFIEIPYTNQYITRSFFSRHCGGARSSVIMPCYTTRYMLSPYMSEELLKIIWSTPPHLLSSEPNCLTYLIFKNYLPELSKIPSNSHLGDYNNTILPNYNLGKHVVYHTTPQYPDSEKIFTENLQKNYSYLFNFEKISSNFFEQNNNKRYVWADLFLWLKYIDEL